MPAKKIKKINFKKLKGIDCRSTKCSCRRIKKCSKFQIWESSSCIGGRNNSRCSGCRCKWKSLEQLEDMLKDYKNKGFETKKIEEIIKVLDDEEKLDNLMIKEKEKEIEKLEKEIEELNCNKIECSNENKKMYKVKKLKQKVLKKKYKRLKLRKLAKKYLETKASEEDNTSDDKDTSDEEETTDEEERKIFGMKPLYFYIIIAIVAVLVIGIIIKLSVGENKKEETNDDFSFD
jgi:hypothetical protein